MIPTNGNQLGDIRGMMPLHKIEAAAMQKHNKIQNIKDLLKQDGAPASKSEFYNVREKMYPGFKKHMQTLERTRPNLGFMHRVTIAKLMSRGLR